MDKRIPLKENTILSPGNGSPFSYQIEKELGRGGSCIVYQAVYETQAQDRKEVRIKEYYPASIDLIRQEDGSLLASETKNQTRFEEGKNAFLQAFRRNNAVFSTRGLTNSTSNTIDIYTHNHTYYVVTTYMEGSVLEYDPTRSIYDSVLITLHTAQTIQKIHDLGYLYLDIKPENLFVIDNTELQIQLFDFDSLYPIGETSDQPISYTKGFAPIEQMSKSRYPLGPQADVYGVGALLYYLLFGNIPTASDSELEARYHFDKVTHSKAFYRDLLFPAITEFFHRTLANFYQDRYSTMAETIHQLTRILSYSKILDLYINSSVILRPQACIGRAQEMEKMRTWDASEHVLLTVSGLPGIGRSTLVREFLWEKKQNSDAVLLYLPYKGSLVDTLIDDEALSIHTVSRSQDESPQAYFERKIQILRELLRQRQAYLVLDDYTGSMDEELLKILSIHWKVIVIRTGPVETDSDTSLYVDTVDHPDDLVKIFSFYLGRKLEERQPEQEYGEKDYALWICHRVGRHPLLISAIARQIAHSHLTMARTLEILEKEGIRGFEKTEITLVRDQKEEYGTILHLMNSLFAVEEDSPEKKDFLKVLGFFNRYSPKLSEFVDFYGPQCRPWVDSLSRAGWLYDAQDLGLGSLCDPDWVGIYPAYRELIRSWEWNETTREKAKSVLKRISEIMLKKEAEQYPSLPIKRNPFTPLQRRPVRRKQEEGAYLQLTDLVQTAQSLLTEVREDPELSQCEEYAQVMALAVIHCPFYDYQFILESFENLRSMKNIPAWRMGEVYDHLLEVLEGQQQFEKAHAYLEEMMNFASKAQDPYVLSLASFAQSSFADFMLNGLYDDPEEDAEMLSRQMQDQLQEGIEWAQKAVSDPTEDLHRRKLLAEMQLTLAITRIRGGEESEAVNREILTCLSQVQDYLEHYTQNREDVLRESKMTLAWYHTYWDPDYEKVEPLLNEAYDLTEKLGLESSLRAVDDMLCPAANICYESGEVIDAIGWLERAIDVCQFHDRSLLHRQKELELLDHLLEVYEGVEDQEMIDQTLEKIDILTELIEGMQEA